MEGKERSGGRRTTSRLSTVVAGLSVLAAVAIVFMTFGIAPVMAQQGEVTTVTVNAPEYVEEGEIFYVTIDVDYIEDFNAGMFDLSFDHKVVKVKDVSDGSIDDMEMPIYYWDHIDSDTIAVISGFPEEIDTKVSGAGYLAKITFEVEGEEDDECILYISNGELTKYVFEDEVATPEAIPAVWIDAELRVGVEEDEEEDEEGEEDIEDEEPTLTPSPTLTPETNVTVTPTPTPTLAPGETPAPTPTLAPGVTPLQEATPAEKTTPKPTAPPTTEEKAMPTPTPEEPGFEVVFAIAVMSTVAYILLRKR